MSAVSLASSEKWKIPGDILEMYQHGAWNDLEFYVLRGAQTLYDIMLWELQGITYKNGRGVIFRSP